MPIVNGSYVPTNLGSDRVNIQQQAFGPDWKPTNKDMSDYSTAAYNYMMKQQEQAYNLELWNLNNEYNSPAAQMQRFQDAGLNPNLIYGQQNTAQAPASASATSFRPANTQQKQMANAVSMIGQIMNVVKSARDTYDYMKYGAETSAWNKNLTMQRSQSQALENYWNSYLLGLPSPDTIPGSPKQVLNQYQMDTAKANYERLRALCSLIPAQEERQKALRTLDERRDEMMRGQYDFILHGFDTGNETLNSFLRMFMMFGMSSMF